MVGGGRGWKRFGYGGSVCERGWDMMGEDVEG